MKLDEISNNHSNKMISIIINCYNGEKYLNNAVESIFNQTYTNWEIIFWDNQSDDKSADIFKSYNDIRLKYFYAPKHTLLYEARNYAIEKAAGEYIAFLDVDDWWSDDKLEKQIKYFNDPEVGMVCGNFWIYDESRKKKWKWYKKKLPEGWVLDGLLKEYFVGMLTLMIRKEAINELNYPCDPRYHIIGDYDLVLRLSLNWKMGCVQRPVATYRIHEKNESLKHRDLYVKEMRNWLKEIDKFETIKNNKNIKYTTTTVRYKEIISNALKNEEKIKFSILKKIPFGIQFLKLFIIIIIPKKLLIKLKNY